MSRSTGRTIAVTVVVTLLVLAGGALAYVHSGAYDVSATKGHTALGRWVLDRTMDRSVAARAADLPEPPPEDTALLAHGFEHYHEMCVACHGAPGLERGEFGQGMMPEPPDLAEEGEELSTRELFWVTKNGIKLAGMPAFGPTHSDEEIWGIVWFVRRLAEMSPEEYQGWVERAEVDPDAPAGHTHPPGTPPHEH